MLRADGRPQRGQHPGRGVPHRRAGQRHAAWSRPPAGRPGRTSCAPPAELIDSRQALLAGAADGRPADRRAGGRRRTRRDRVRRRRRRGPRAAAAVATSCSAGWRRRCRTPRPPAIPSTWPAAASRTSTTLAITARILLESGEVDGVLMSGYFGGYAQYSEEFEEAEVAVARDIAAPSPTPAGRWSRRRCTTARRPPRPSARAASRSTRRSRPPPWPTVALVERPPPAGAPVAPAADPTTARRRLPRLPRSARARRRAVRGGPPRRAHRRGGAAVGRRARASRSCSRRWARCTRPTRAASASASPTAEALDRRPAATCSERLAPPEFSVERMAPLADGVELIVGARRDARFGPVAMVGLGGIYAETVRGRRDRPGAARRQTRRSGCCAPSAGRRCSAPCVAGRRWTSRAAAEAAAALSSSGGGPPRHRRDRDQPAAGDAVRRPGAGCANHPRDRRRQRCWLTAPTRAGRHRHRRRQRDGAGDGAGVRPAGRGGGGRRPPAGAAGRDGGR